MNAGSRVDRGFEPTDASPRGIVIVTASLAVGIALSFLAASWLYRAHDAERPRDRVESFANSFRHGSEERSSIEKTWSELEPETQAHLRGYHWRDREHGVVQIPIERAMELIAEENR
jgi:hypothetical protein